MNLCKVVGMNGEEIHPEEEVVITILDNLLEDLKKPIEGITNIEERLEFINSKYEIKLK